LFAGLVENDRGFSNAWTRSTRVMSTSHRQCVNSTSTSILGTLRLLLDVYAHKQHELMKQ